jgi:glucose/arabinose dehydrogenase
MHDDGRLPADNPFVNVPGAVKSIWTYGHRSMQGLEFNHQTGELWSTEMGPRGGDELNRLQRGGNYGWPIFTSGINYDGRPVDVADELGIELRPEETIFPVVDMTPSPALSSFIFYQGEKFPNWNGNILLGTLRATDLLRMEVVDDQVVHTEVLLRDLARFRDIETGPDGAVYILLEHTSGGRIIRLVPVTPADAG